MRDPAAKFDGLGRKQPQRLGFVQFARAIPGYVQQFSGRVPDEQVKREPGTATLTCVCGRQHTLQANLPIECGGCNRVFALVAGRVRVAYLYERAAA